jgi:tRNA(adenine34) deaminase
MLALTAAMDHLNTKHLSDCHLYVTTQPCMMCAGAIYQSRLKRLVVGAKLSNQKSASKQFSLPGQLEVKQGLMAKECTELWETYQAQKPNEK